MVTCFGMSPALGSVTIGEAGGEVFLGASLQDMGSVGPQTLDMIDEETERIVEEAKARAVFVLRANWEPVQEIARALLEQETLSGVALEALLSTVSSIDFGTIPLPEAERRRSSDGASSCTPGSTSRSPGSSGLRLPRLALGADRVGAAEALGLADRLAAGEAAVIVVVVDGHVVEGFRSGFAGAGAGSGSPVEVLPRAPAVTPSEPAASAPAAVVKRSLAHLAFVEDAAGGVGEFLGPRGAGVVVDRALQRRPCGAAPISCAAVGSQPPSRAQTWVA